MTGLAENPNPINTLTEWLGRLAAEKGIIGGGHGMKGTHNYPEGYLKVISVLSGLGRYSEETEDYRFAHEWRQRTEDKNDGKFDPVVLYDLMLEERSDPKK